jgi:PAS domain S-box-containing protein
MHEIMTAHPPSTLHQITGERRFELMVDAITDYAIYLLEPNGFISSWNSGAERIKGYTADEVIGKHFSMFYPPEEAAAGVPDRALAAARTHGRHETEGRSVRKDGSQFWALSVLDAIKDEAGNVIGFAKITRDITERVQAQKALLESERQFRLLVDGVVDHALFMLDPNGVITSWNKGAQRIKGYTADEIIGQHLSTFYTPEDRAAGVPQRALATAAEAGKYEAEGWRVRKDGSRFWASVVLDAIRNPEGKLVGFAKITRDITERRATQLAMQRMQEQLAETQKMEALGQLTGGVAHDFNNLLMVVAGQAHILKRRVTDSKALRAIDFIEQAMQRGASLTKQLLAFARRQQLTPTVVNVSERMHDVSELLTSAVEGNMEFETDVGETLWPVEADVGELELALVNLAVNARDAMPNGGVVRLKARNVSLDGRGTPPLKGDFVTLTMSDTGRGIPPEILSRVFEPFFTTKEIGKGTGLGLSQVHGFAHQSGGTVTIDSEIGSGTKVTIYLPRSSRPLSPACEEAGTTATETATGTVLVVEDNPEVAEVSSSLLEDLGYRVTLARTAREALDRLESHPDVDLLFSDIVMPGGMDGVALARTVRERFPGIPVLLTSGYSRAMEEARGRFPILAKPYTTTALASAVRSALTGKSAAVTHEA